MCVSEWEAGGKHSGLWMGNECQVLSVVSPWCWFLVIVQKSILATVLRLGKRRENNLPAFPHGFCTQFAGSPLSLAGASLLAAHSAGLGDMDAKLF